MLSKGFCCAQECFAMLLVDVGHFLMAGLKAEQEEVRSRVSMDVSLSGLLELTGLSEILKLFCLANNKQLKNTRCDKT